jgi:hypothetical protein
MLPVLLLAGRTLGCNNKPLCLFPGQGELFVELFPVFGATFALVKADTRAGVGEATAALVQALKVNTEKTEVVGIAHVAGASRVDARSLS